MQILTLATEDLGDRTYVVHDGQDAIVIDPQRDLDRVESLIAEAGVTVTLVLETHIHNDYVTGGHALAERTRARYGVNADDPVSFDRLAIRPGDRLVAGHLEVEVVATPGHTETHLAFIVRDCLDLAVPPALFTGGSLLFGGVGRTDLVATRRTEEMTRAQYRSAHHLARLLPENTSLYPTHGFGSFCSSGAVPDWSTSTIGYERRHNTALRADDEDRFVTELIAGLTAYPAYYSRMAPQNLRGPAAADLTGPKPVDADELAKRIADGEWVVDLRDRRLYASDHLTGSVSIELGNQFATTLGWLMPEDMPLTLIGDTVVEVTTAQRQLVRIGVDVDAAAAGSFDHLAVPSHARSEYPKAGFAALAHRALNDAVLDVRRVDEYRAGHIREAIHIPLHELPTRMAELPDTRLWVHCASGFRSSVAASLLARAGCSVVYVDDEFTTAIELGLTT
jgi:hydroxyacylglutathione hydrolase